MFGLSKEEIMLLLEKVGLEEKQKKSNCEHYVS